MSDIADIRISVHEAVCAERYKSIDSRIGRIEKMQYVAIGWVVTQMAAVIWYLSTHLVTG